MAIDTLAKRFSIMDFAGPAAMPGVPVPDGAIDQGDRQHLLWLYSGIAADNPSPGGTSADYIIFARRRQRR